MKRAIGVALFFLSLGTTASAADLLSVYQDALASDPAIREADATRKASREVRPQAWSALLPQINGQGSWTRGTQDSTQTVPQNVNVFGQVVVITRVSHIEPDIK